MKKTIVLIAFLLPTFTWAGGSHHAPPPAPECKPEPKAEPKPVYHKPPVIVTPAPVITPIQPSVISPTVTNESQIVTSSPSTSNGSPRMGGHRHPIDNTYLKVQLIDLMQQLVVLLRKKIELTPHPTPKPIYIYPQNNPNAKM